ncbi:hypothetical protein ELS18_12350 [Clostridium perfringens]|uniref:hypothetical protein n=1 Tax=Clostridium perfringens TaxID=1502 RepID=UPI000F8EADAE|nr:hypothetical protein [Clostridium perfringens]RUR36880.1 hypothetical protein ELS18_12350 [Clostridium perfringens]
MLDELLSNALLICITLVGLGYIVSGKPRRYTERVEDRRGEHVYIRKNNFTKKIILAVITIIIIKILITEGI